MHYQIIRIMETGEVVCNAIEDGNEKQIKPIGWHCPEFNFGHGGSGPAELALAILADYFGEPLRKSTIWSGDSKAWTYHQDFKWQFLAGSVDRCPWFEIKDTEIAEFCLKAQDTYPQQELSIGGTK